MKQIKTYGNLTLVPKLKGWNALQIWQNILGSFDLWWEGYDEYSKN